MTNKQIIRKAQFAGKFYPAGRDDLREMVDGFLRDARDVRLPEGVKLKAIIVPHAGYIYSGIVAASGYRLINFQFSIFNFQTTKKVILIGPSHNEYFRGAAIDDSDEWETPLGKVKLGRLGGLGKLGEAHKYEHSLEVQVPFLQRVLKGPACRQAGFEIVPILYGGIEVRGLVEAVNSVYSSYKNYKDEEKMIVVSSDLSHYYSYEEAVRIDKAANEAIPALDIKRAEEEVEACGKTGILAIMHLAKKIGWKGMFLDYKNSGDTFGDKSRVVGYGAYGFYK